MFLLVLILLDFYAMKRKKLFLMDVNRHRQLYYVLFYFSLAFEFGDGLMERRGKMMKGGGNWEIHQHVVEYV